MKRILFTIATAALGSFNCQAQSQLNINNTTGTTWNCEYYAKDPTVPGRINIYRSGIFTIVPGPLSWSSPQQILTWIDQNGNSVPSWGIPPNSEWTIIRIWNPCGISGNPGQDIITLQTGLITGTTAVLNDMAATPTQCPSITTTQIIGQLNVSNPGVIQLQIQ